MKHAELWEQLVGLIERGEREKVEAFIEQLTSVETALTISRLDDEMQTRLISLLTPDDAADMLRDLSHEQAAELIGEISPAVAAAIVDRFPTDEQVDILGDMNSSDAEAILNAMSDEDAACARELLRYPPDTAGGLMTQEYLAYSSTTKVGEVILDLERQSERYTEYQVQYSYVIDTVGRLLGVLRLRDVLLASRDREISALMISDPQHVTVDRSLNDLVRVFQESRFIGVPVVDSQGRLTGLVERTAVESARRQQVRNVFLRISGIIGGEELRSTPFYERTARRLAWLGPNIILNIMAASVIALYQDTLQAAIALAVFLPIISDMSGCSGNQAVAVSIRELSLGLITPKEVTRVFAKESWVGLVNGVLLGLLLGTVAFLWKGNFYLSFVVATALAANTLLSVVLGGSVPLLLKRIRVDPALASGPILTTITDMCGFFLVLSIAQSLLEKL